jgi:sugar phosphate isomerase/epimerase
MTEVAIFKNLNAAALGVSGRQSELIELAMTYGFRGLNIDLVDLVKRTKRSTFERAARYLHSAKLKIGGFEVPLDLDSDDETFAKGLAGLAEAAELAAKVDAKFGMLMLPSATDRLPFHEFFDVLRKRVEQIAKVMGQYNVELALCFTAAVDKRQDKQFKFIQDVEGFLAFLKACPEPNVRMVLDTWEWHVGGGNLEQLAALDPSLIVSVRMADLPADVSTAQATSSDRLMPGQSGLIDSGAILKLLADRGYQGPITAFAHPKGLGGMTRDGIVAYAQDCLDKVLSEAGLPTFTRKPDQFLDGYDQAAIDAEVEAEAAQREAEQAETEEE